MNTRYGSRTYFERQQHRRMRQASNLKNKLRLGTDRKVETIGKFPIPILVSKSLASLMISQRPGGCALLSVISDTGRHEVDLGESDDMRVLKHVAQDILRMRRHEGGVLVYERPGPGFEVQKDRIFTLESVEYNKARGEAIFRHAGKDRYLRISPEVLGILMWIFVRRTTRSIGVSRGKPGTLLFKVLP